MADRIPVVVGQIRRDPDPRMNGRRVRVLEVGVPGVGGGPAPAEVAAQVETVFGPSLTKTRIRLCRLERWEVVDG